MAADVVTNEEKRSEDGVTFLIPFQTRLDRQLGLVPNTKPRFSFLPNITESTVAAAAVSVGRRKWSSCWANGAAQARID